MSEHELYPGGPPCECGEDEWSPRHYGYEAGWEAGRRSTWWGRFRDYFDARSPVLWWTIYRPRWRGSVLTFIAWVIVAEWAWARRRLGDWWGSKWLDMYWHERRKEEEQSGDAPRP